MSRKKKEDPKPRKVQIIFEVEENAANVCLVMCVPMLVLSAANSIVRGMTWGLWN